MKNLLCLSLLVVLVIALIGVDGRRGRDRHGGRLQDALRGRHRGRHMRQRDEFPMARWFSKLFRPGKFHFEFGSDDFEEDLFDFSLNWFDSVTPWYDGPNVCFSRTEEKEDPKTDDEGQIRFHHRFETQICDESELTYKCTTTLSTSAGKATITEIHECCPGFSRKPGDSGCQIERKLLDLASTARELDLNEMIRAIEAVNLLPTITEGDTNFTIFGPTDAAFQKLEKLPESGNEIPLQDMGSMVIVSEKVTEALVQDTRNLILGHLSLGRLTSTHLSNNQLIETASPFKSKIRVNLYDQPQQVITADCKRVVSTDNVALNGVIHVVEEILQPVTDTLMDKISRNPDLSYLKTAIGQTSLGQMLRDEGDFTLFAPTDNAFRNMDQSLLNKLLADEKCLTKILKNHILPTVVCSAIIQGKTRASNALRNHVSLTRDDDNKLYIDGVQIINKDDMATNGVLYLIDDVLLVDDALNALTIVERSGATRLLDWIESAGLTKDVANMENVTILVPTNEAIEATDEAVLSDLLSDPQKLQDVLKYHIVPNKVSCNSLYDNVQLDTLNGNRKISINEYSTFPFGSKWVQTAQCAKVIKSNIKSCNAIIHVVDKVLLPPSGNVVDVLAMDYRFSNLTHLLKKADLADTLQENGQFTVFAPTNEVFEALGSDAIQELLDNRDQLVEILKNHIVKGSICCSGIFRGNWVTSQKVRTLAGEKFQLSRNRDDQPTIEDATVTECDNTGSNGVVHVIDQVLMNGKKFGPFRDWFY